MVFGNIWEVLAFVRMTRCLLKKGEILTFVRIEVQNGTFFHVS